MTDAIKKLHECAALELATCNVTGTTAREFICIPVSIAFAAIRDLEGVASGTHVIVPVEGERYEHRKGGRYTKVGVGKIQTTQPLADMAEVVIYRSEKDGSLWARNRAEFDDGRFRLVPVEG